MRKSDHRKPTTKVVEFQIRFWKRKNREKKRGITTKVVNTTKVVGVGTWGGFLLVNYRISISQRIEITSSEI